MKLDVVSYDAKHCCPQVELQGVLQNDEVSIYNATAAEIAAGNNAQGHSVCPQHRATEIEIHLSPMEDQLGSINNY